MSLLISVCIFTAFHLLPNKSGEYSLSYHTSGEAHVYFEDNGVPHIIADNMIVASYAAGYVQASDRLWQMEYLRRMSQGKFSEIMGSATYEMDESIRVLGFKEACENVFIKQLDPKVSEVFQAYYDGINYYAHNNILPLQFQIFRIEYEDWSMIDTCSISKLMHFMLSGNYGPEIFRDYLTAISGDKEIADMLLNYNPDTFNNLTVPIISDEELKRQGLYKAKIDPKITNYLISDPQKYILETVEEIVESVQGVSFEGSNAWAVSGKHTKSGKPINCNDPHLGNSVPSIWYLAHIELSQNSSSNDMVPNWMFGGTLPGTLAPLVMTTDKLSMSVTSAVADSIDLYEEKLVENGTKYEFEGKLYNVTVREEIIKVRGQEDVKVLVKSTHHGPILTPACKAFREIASLSPSILPTGDYSLSFVGTKDTVDTYMNDVFQVLNSSSAKDAMEIMRNSRGIIQNTIIVDNQGEHGNIAFVTSGSFQIKKNGEIGSRISRGWVAENEWEGYYKGSEKPYLYNPEQGYIVMANNPVVSPHSKTHLSSYSQGTARAIRINQLLQTLVDTKSGSIVYEDMVNVLNDNKDAYAEHKVVHMVGATKNYLALGSEKNTTKAQMIMKKLSDWNATFGKDQEEPIYYTLWEYFTRKNLFNEDIGYENDAKIRIMSITYFDMTFNAFYEKVHNDPQYAKKYCSLYQDKKIRSCAELLYNALNEAIDYVDSNLDSQNLKWSDLHQMIYPNIPFTKTPLKFLFDRSVPADGNFNTVNVAAFRFFRFDTNLFAGVHSANIKLISEMNGNVHYSLDTGQSENILSSFYFSMNAKHMQNDLYKLRHSIGFKSHGMNDPNIVFKFTSEVPTEKVDDL